jgi:hypothetical protein
MGVIVGVESFAIRTKILSAEGTAVPLPNDAQHVPVAKSESMLKIAQIS